MLTRPGQEKLQKLRIELDALIQHYADDKDCDEARKNVSGFIAVITEIEAKKDLTVTNAQAWFQTLEKKFLPFYKMPKDNPLSRDIYVLIDDAIKHFSLEADIQPTLRKILQAMTSLPKVPISLAAACNEARAVVLNHFIHAWRKQTPQEVLEEFQDRIEEEFNEIFDAFDQVLATTLEYAVFKQQYIKQANQWLTEFIRLPYRIFFADNQGYLQLVAFRKSLLKKVVLKELELNKELIASDFPPIPIIIRYLADRTHHLEEKEHVPFLHQQLHLQLAFLKNYISSWTGRNSKKKLAKEMHNELEKMLLDYKKEEKHSELSEQNHLRRLTRVQLNTLFKHFNLIRKEDIGPGDMGENLDRHFLLCYDAATQQDNDFFMRNFVKNILDFYQITFAKYYYLSAAPEPGLSELIDFSEELIHLLLGKVNLPAPVGGIVCDYLSKTPPTRLAIT